MKNQITIEVAKHFKQPYSYTMGGTQTIKFESGESFDFNDKQYYSGRGSKYNSSIKHDNKGVIKVSDKELREYFKAKRKSELFQKQIAKEKRELHKRIDLAKKQGVYSITNVGWAFKVELSETESEQKYFDAERLANTFKIPIEDAELLNSIGKTYVFATTTEGKILELYHASLDCNPLNIFVIEATGERLAEFNHDKWAAAPFAENVGQSENKNHFVC